MEKRTILRIKSHQHAQSVSKLIIKYNKKHFWDYMGKVSEYHKHWVNDSPQQYLKLSGSNYNYPIAPNIGSRSPWNSTLRRERSCLMKRCKRLTSKRGRTISKGCLRNWFWFWSLAPWWSSLFSPHFVNLCVTIFDIIWSSNPLKPTVS